MFALVAFVQLTYSMDDASGALVEPGDVRIAKMDHYYPKNNTAEIPSLGGEQATVHNYGYISSSYLQGNVSDLLEILDVGVAGSGTFLTYNLVDHWVYQYYEANTKLRANYYTNRTVNVTWLCSAYDVVDGGDGSTNDITYLDGDQRVPFFVGQGGPAATTYITETQEVCGPRCARVWAFQSAISAMGILPTLYDCNITVSNVSNAYQPEHLIPDMQARLAAGSIGLEGFQRPNTTRQWVRYHDKWVHAFHIMATVDRLGETDRFT